MKESYHQHEVGALSQLPVREDLMSRKREVLPSRVLAAIGRSKTFGERLNQVLEVTGTRVPQLSSDLGHRSEVVWEWVRDETMPDPDNLKRLSAELGVPKGLLLFGQGKSMRARLADTSGVGDTIFTALKELSQGTPELEVEARLRLSQGTTKRFLRKLWAPHPKFADRGDLLLWAARDPSVPEVNNSRFIQQLEWAQQYDLSTQQIRVLRFLLEGKGNKEIGPLLGVTSKVVGNWVLELKTKLELPSTGISRASLVSKALELGFPTGRVESDPPLDTTQQAVSLFKTGRFSWGDSSIETRRFFVQSLADYLGKPVAELTSGDFAIRIPAFSHKTINGLLNQYSLDGLSKTESLDKLLKDVGCDRESSPEQHYVHDLKSGRLRDWSVVPKTVRLSMLEVLSAHVKKPLAELRPRDFQVKVPQLGNKTLAGLAKVYGSKNTVISIKSLLRDLGITPISRGKLGQQEALSALSANHFQNRTVLWEDTTTQARRYLLVLLGWDLGKLPESLNTSDFKARVPSFGEHSLIGLLALFERKYGSLDIALTELKHSVGFKDTRPERKKSRSPADLAYENMDEVQAIVGNPYMSSEDGSSTVIRPLERDEEIKLSGLIQKGNRAAYWVLVGSQANYLRWRARTLLESYGKKGSDLLREEMIAAGEKVIETNALKYTSIKGAKLSTFTWTYVGHAMRAVIFKQSRQGNFELDETRDKAPGLEEDSALEDVAVALDGLRLHVDPVTDLQYKNVFMELLAGKGTLVVADEFHLSPYRVRQIRKEVLATLNQYQSRNGSNGSSERFG